MERIDFFLRQKTTISATLLLRAKGSKGTFVNLPYISLNLNLKIYLFLFQGRNLLSLSTTEGLTPLSLAIINGQTAIIEAYFQHRIAKKSIYLQSDIIKDSCLTIPHLLFQFSPLTHPKCLLKRKDNINYLK